MKEDVKIQFIQCGEIKIAASCITKSSEEFPVYIGSAMLSFARKGQMHIRTGNELHSVPKGSFVLLRKYTHSHFLKTFTEEEGEAKTYSFVLNDNVIRKVIKSANFPTNIEPIGERVIMLSATPQLLGLMDSIAQFVDHGQDIDPNLVELKTLEALMAIVNADPQLAAIFLEYSKAEKADLSKFMNFNFLRNTTLHDLAKESGRSLSTFNREFRLIFNETPHKWVLRKRLDQAKKLLVGEGLKASDVYLQVGFEDLAHFSKAFKRHFGISPSKMA